MALADVFPAQLAFHFQAGRSLSCHFEVANVQPSASVAFKLKTSAPSDYVVKPGKVPPAGQHLACSASSI